jgi:hypothetical protein
MRAPLLGSSQRCDLCPDFGTHAHRGFACRDSATQSSYGAALGDWRGVRDAPPEDVLATLAPVTFSEKKAPALQAALRRITRHNEGDLLPDFFSGRPVERIRRWLESFSGVGVKGSAAVVNHSSLRLRGLATDSHLHRIAKRLGLVSEAANPAHTEQAWLQRMPEDRWPPARRYKSAIWSSCIDDFAARAGTGSKTARTTRCCRFVHAGQRSSPGPRLWPAGLDGSWRRR